MLGWIGMHITGPARLQTLAAAAAAAIQVQGKRAKLKKCSLVRFKEKDP
jgi:hypothetical protein